METITDLQAIFQFSRQETYRRMLADKPKKYRWFLRAIRSVRHLYPTRGTILESIYLAMRQIDDIVDKDLPLPSPTRSPDMYIKDRLRFVSTLTPTEPPDYLLLLAFQLADQTGLDLTPEANDMLTSLLFDAHRIQQPKSVFPQEELNRHFHFLDIRGTIRCVLKLLREDPTKYFLIEPLGQASRIYYTLRDFEEDLQKGYLNISQEAMEQHRISPDNLESRLSPGVPVWYREEANRGLQLLDQHQVNLHNNKFPLIARLAFPLLYAHSARQYFKHVLNGSQRF